MIRDGFSFPTLFLCLLGSALLLLAGCGQRNEALHLQPMSFAKLPGWEQDSLREVAPAFSRSCVRIMKRSGDQAFGPLSEAGTYGDWQAVCSRFLAENFTSDQQLRVFFEESFVPFEVRAGAEPQGLFTGYYEASLRGSRQRQGPYQTPLYSRPDDLVMVQLGDFREHLKGERIAGRVVSGALKPFETRAEIVEGQSASLKEPLVWVDDPVDAFFVQIQGSGVVEMTDGSVMRIGYAGQNGHPYYAIGRELIKRGDLTKESVSMQSIRAWLESHPDEAVHVMNTNRSYVFFRELDGDGPLGGEGVALTAGRSLAIDRSLLPYGVPFWLEADHPKNSKQSIRRLMMAQDTGGAIRGAVRGDVFWGYGSQAEHMAGAMKSEGRYWILLPKSLYP